MTKNGKVNITGMFVSFIILISIMVLGLFATKALFSNKKRYVNKASDLSGMVQQRIIKGRVVFPEYKRGFIEIVAFDSSGRKPARE